MCSILGSTSDRKDIKVNGQALKSEMFDTTLMDSFDHILVNIQAMTGGSVTDPTSINDTTSKVQLQVDMPQSEKDGVRLEMADPNYTIPTTRAHRLQR